MLLLLPWFNGLNDTLANPPDSKGDEFAVSWQYHSSGTPVALLWYHVEQFSGTMKVIWMRTDNNKREKENVWYQWYHRCATRNISTLSSGTMTALLAVPDERYYQHEITFVLWFFSQIMLWNRVYLGENDYICTVFRKEYKAHHLRITTSKK